MGVRDKMYDPTVIYYNRLKNFTGKLEVNELSVIMAEVREEKHTKLTRKAIFQLILYKN